MPFLDVSEVLLDPDLADSFTVIRRQQLPGTAGAQGTIMETRYDGIIGTVCHATPDQLRRDPDKATTGRGISIVSQFRFRGTAADVASRKWQPDEIIWEGGRYVVSAVDPYTRFGGGFVEVVAESKSTQDEPFTNLPVAVGRFSFNFPRNSGYAGVIRAC